MNFFENQWVEVFRAGVQTDSSGNTRKWTTSDLKKIVNNYNAQKHEAPVVVGHPRDNTPAFGWVEALKTDGKILFARFKELVPEFIDAVKRGMYKKRSISLYPDLTLRHIGFLGAVPPAVKGLADIKFSENNGSITLETDTKKKESRFMAANPKGEKNNYIPQSVKDREINELKNQLKQEQRKNRRIEFREFVNGLHSEGKIVSELQDTVIDLMEALYELGEYNFSEGKSKAISKFKDYLRKQPKMVEFGEKVKEEMVSQSTASEQLNILAIERAKEDNLSYSDALSLVQAEYPDLAEKSVQEL